VEEVGGEEAMKECGSCKWWLVLNDWEDKNHDRYATGDCRYPMPFWMQKFQPYRSSGTDCPTYEAKP
jgi:hypothetical protein